MNLAPFLAQIGFIYQLTNLLQKKLQVKYMATVKVQYACPFRKQNSSLSEIYYLQKIYAELYFYSLLNSAKWWKSGDSFVKCAV